MVILNKRPEGMDYERYRSHMRLQAAWLRERCRRPVTYYVSWKEIPQEKSMAARIEEKRYITNPPFRGSVRRDLTRPA